MESIELERKQQVGKLFLWFCEAREKGGLPILTQEHFEALDAVFAELHELRAKLKRAGKAGRPKSKTPPKTSAERVAAHRARNLKKS